MKDRNSIKRKLLTDRKLPDSEQISQHKDFKSLQKSQNLIKSNWLKKLFIGGGAVLGTAVVALVVYFNTIPGTVIPIQEVRPDASIQQESYIQQPLQDKDVPYSVYKISVKNGGIIHHETGSQITIPANAFVIKDGSVLSDSIIVKYREFHNPYDIFISGIPMKYDSAGVCYTFESAGMIEIRGYDGDKPLLLDEQKVIEVAMVSANDEKNFNLYELDTVNRKWLYKGKDQIVAVESSEQTQKNTKVENAEPAVTPVSNEEMLIKPQMADPTRYCFNIVYDKNEFPELEAYNNVMFEVTDNSFNPSFYKVNWDKISLHSSDTKGIFVVKLNKADTIISILAKPVFSKDNYGKALEEFETKHKNAERKTKVKDSERNSKLNEVDKELSSYNRANFIRAANFKVDRRFSIRSFGIYNSDRPIPPRVVETQQVANLLDKKSREEELGKATKSGISYSAIYLIEKGKNAVFTFDGTEAVNLNTNAQNLIWTITDKREIAFFKASDFNTGKRRVMPIVAGNKAMALKQIKEFSN